MSFNWEDYIDLADELAQKSEESCLRSSISRAYFGVFCIARNREFGKGFVRHKELIRKYRKSHNPTKKNISVLIDELRRTRNEADYEEDQQITKDDAERMLIVANEVLADLKVI